MGTQAWASDDQSEVTLKVQGRVFEVLTNSLDWLHRGVNLSMFTAPGWVVTMARGRALLVSLFFIGFNLIQKKMENAWKGLIYHQVWWFLGLSGPVLPCSTL